MGRVVGVAYLTLTVHVPPAASGVVKEQVVAGVRLYKPPKLSAKVSAVICSEPAPVLVIVTTLVTGARGVGMVNVSVRSIVPTSVPLVAEVKLSWPTTLPVRLTGDPATGALPEKVSVPVTEVVVVAVNTTL